MAALRNSGIDFRTKPESIRSLFFPFDNLFRIRRAIKSSIQLNAIEGPAVKIQVQRRFGSGRVKVVSPIALRPIRTPDEDFKDRGRAISP